MNADEKFLAQINRDKQLRTALEASKAQDKLQGKFLDSFVIEEKAEVGKFGSLDYVRRSESISKFGNVYVYELWKDYFIENYSIDSTSKDVAWVLESIMKLSYSRDDKSLIFEDIVKEMEGAWNDFDYEIIHKSFFVKKDFSVDELLKELKDYGFRYEFAHSQEEIHLLLEINRELLLSKLNIDNVPSTIKLEASKAQKKLQEELGKYNLKQSNN